MDSRLRGNDVVVMWKTKNHAGDGHAFILAVIPAKAGIHVFDSAGPERRVRRDRFTSRAVPSSPECKTTTV